MNCVECIGSVKCALSWRVTFVYCVECSFSVEFAVCTTGNSSLWPRHEYQKTMCSL